MTDHIPTIYGYARVSTKGQARDGNSLEDQTNKLRSNGASVIFTDSFTGTKIDRPELDKLIAMLQPGDTLIVTKLDRIARSTTQGLQFIDSLLSKDIKVHILNMGMMDNTPTGKLIRTIMFAFAEFERDMIVQRTSEGKAVARQNPDYHEGRPAKPFDADRFRTIYENDYLTHRMTAEQCASALGISRRSFFKYAKQLPQFDQSAKQYATA